MESAASSMIPRIDKRRLRAQALVHRILQIVSKHLSDEDYRRNALREINYDLMELCMKEGVEIITDYTRTDMGLPQRGPDGWTMEEIIALEQRRLELMYAPLTMTIPKL
jgi:hypothetical protein